MNTEQQKLFDDLQEAREQVQTVTEKLFVVDGLHAKHFPVVRKKIQKAKNSLADAFRELVKCQDILKQKK